MCAEIDTHQRVTPLGNISSFDRTCGFSASIHCYRSPRAENDNQQKETHLQNSKRHTLRTAPGSMELVISPISHSPVTARAPGTMLVLLLRSAKPLGPFTGMTCQQKSAIKRRFRILALNCCVFLEINRTTSESK